LSRVAVPVLVKAEVGRFRQVADEVRALCLEVPGRLTRLLTRIMPLGFDYEEFPRFNMVAAILPREAVYVLGEMRGVEKVYLDTPVYAFRYPTVPPEGVYEIPHRVLERVAFTSTWWTKKLIGADVANEKGFRGRGVLVSVCDTGGTPFHEQTARVRMETAMRGQYTDFNGHGEWCLACVGGVTAIDEVLSRRSGKRVVCEGMAPECGLLSVKCLGFVVGTGMTSNIIKALHVSLDYGADIVSMSLGGPSQTDRPEDDAFYPVMEELVASNVIPVCAAGNEGPEPRTVASPGCMPQVLTVGAYDPITGEVAEYSSRGPTNWGDVKPDVIAPGGGYPDHGIDSAITGMLDKAGDNVPNRYSPIQGTSMATPHVAGLLALMRESAMKLLGKVLTVDEVKSMMSELGEPKSNVSGWGLITWHMWEHWLETEYSVEL